jgi:hypothetical protein
MLRKSEFPILFLNIIKEILFAITLLYFVSCYRDPININLDEFGNKIVIEGNITDNEGTTVRISRTVHYNDENDFPPVQGASVTIENQTGEFSHLTEIQPGLYRDYSFRGIPGNTYSLTVITDYERYTASSTMPQPLLLETIEFNEIAPGVNIFELSMSLIEHSGINDYCIINLYQNGYLADQVLYNDSQNDGNLVEIEYFDMLFYLNELVTIELITIDESIYEFFHTLNMIEESEEDDDELAGTFIPVTTFNPTTNWDNGALGYFSANTINRYSIRVN